MRHDKQLALPNTKLCIACGRYKLAVPDQSASEFYFFARRKRDPSRYIYHTYCKLCSRIRSREYARSHAGSIARRKRRNCAKYREKRRQYDHAHIHTRRERNRRYGQTPIGKLVKALGSARWHLANTPNLSPERRKRLQERMATATREITRLRAKVAREKQLAEA